MVSSAIEEKNRSNLQSGFWKCLSSEIPCCKSLHLLFRMDGIAAHNTHLAFQDLNKLNVKELTPLTHEVISRQATLNIGTIGMQPRTAQTY